MHSCTNLKLEAKRFIERRFTDVIKEDEFYELPKETLRHFLKSEGLSIDSEFQNVQWIWCELRTSDMYECLRNVLCNLMDNLASLPVKQPK